VDPDGVDNIEGNSDDEECDDDNTINGDGCSASCDDEDIPTINQCMNGAQDA